LISNYNPTNHPHSLTRKKDPESIKNDFDHAIAKKACPKGRVTQAAFVDYYAELNFCIPNERQSVSIVLSSISNNSSSLRGTFKNLKNMSLTKD
jgi:hypothetical protein